MGLETQTIGSSSSSSSSSTSTSTIQASSMTGPSGGGDALPKFPVASQVELYWGRAVSYLIGIQESNPTVKTVCRVVSILFPASFVGILLTLAIRRADLLKQPKTLGLFAFVGVVQGVAVKWIIESQKQIATNRQLEEQAQNLQQQEKVTSQIREVFNLDRKEPFGQDCLKLAKEDFDALNPDLAGKMQIGRGEVEGKPFVFCLVQPRNLVGGSSSEMWIFYVDEASWKYKVIKEAARNETETSLDTDAPRYVSHHSTMPLDIIPRVIKELKEGTYLSYKLITI